MIRPFWDLHRLARISPTFLLIPVPCRRCCTHYKLRNCLGNGVQFLSLQRRRAAWLRLIIQSFPCFVYLFTFLFAAPSAHMQQAVERIQRLFIQCIDPYPRLCRDCRRVKAHVRALLCSHCTCRVGQYAQIAGLVVYRLQRLLAIGWLPVPHPAILCAQVIQRSIGEQFLLQGKWKTAPYLLGHPLALLHRCLHLPSSPFPVPSPYPPQINFLCRFCKIIVNSV